MAEMITATRPDGSVVEVSRKAFDLIYRLRGYTEGDTTKETGDNTGTDYPSKTSTRPKPKRKSTLTPDVVANGPSEKTK